MRVCWLKIGGWAPHFDERAEALADHVDNLLIIRPACNGNYGCFKRSDVETIDLLPRHESDDHIWFKIFCRVIWVIQTFLIYLYWVRQNDSVDVIHSVDPPLGVSALLSVLTRTPLIVSIRGLHSTRQNNTSHESIVSWKTITRILYYIRWVSFKRTSHVIVKSEHQIDYLIDRYSYPRPQITAIPTGVDFEQFHPERVDESDILIDIHPTLKTRDRIVLYLGRVSQSKGVDQMLTNIADAQFDAGIHFLFVGEYENEAFRTNVEELVSKYELEEQLTIHSEWIPLDRVPELLYSVDVLCLLSEPGVEGVPRVLQEACAMETPIVAADVPGISEAFEDLEGCYLIDRENELHFRAAILESFEASPDRRQCRNQFDIERNYERYLEIYRKICT